MENKKINEDSATGGAGDVSGLGNVVNSIPSALPGTTTDPNYTLTGGVDGSGDVSIPFNATNNVSIFQKIPANKNKDKKRNTNFVKSLDDFKKSITKPELKTDNKVMKWSDFLKDDITKIKK
jgi:hypothetical protein